MEKYWEKENERRLQGALKTLQLESEDQRAEGVAERCRELAEEIERLQAYQQINMLEPDEALDLRRAKIERERMLRVAKRYPPLLAPPAPQASQLPKPAPARPADQDEQVDPDLNTGRRAPRRRPSTRTLLKVVAAMALFGLGALFNQATGGPAPRDTSSAAALPLAVTVPSPSPSAKAKPTHTPTPEPKRVVPADCKDANYYGNELITLHYAYVDAVGDLLTAYTQGNEAGIKKARDTMDKNHEKMAAAADSFRLGNHACQ